ncbi:MAG TPA: choice-of-anchor D domain-containing protein [Candidatus Dormibacteraeota bacterium]|nr:choice-of-anchor D domain-containing protein [Candidatus Dormibacteraeota bacterium]
MSRPPIRPKYLRNAAAVILLLAGLAFLVGCQGVSAGGNSQGSPGVLGSNPASLSFGNVTVGKNQSLSGTITNTGGSNVTISQIEISGAGFTLSGITAPLTLAAGQGATFSVKFAPAVSGTVNGNVTVTSDASNTTFAIGVSGSGTAAVGTLGASSSSLSFGNITVGQNKTISETITNTGGSSVAISVVAISGTGFTLSGITAPLTLTAGQSTSFSVKFAPGSAVNASGDVTLTSDASDPTLTISLSGAGTAASGQLSISPTTLALSSVEGSSGTASGSLTASGASVTVTAASTNNSLFTVSGLSLPATIAAGQSVPFTITFSPLTTGTVNATLTVTSNAQPSTTTEALTGTGTAAPTHSVNLSWNASSSSNISGYNVYRALYTSSCGAYVKINPLLNTGTLYTDSTVANGNSYCYAATAVDTSNQESGYSNIVSNVKIPLT